MTMGISTKGSRKELENRIGKYNGEAASLARQKAELELSGLKRSIASAGSGGIGVNLNDPVEMNNYYNSLFGGNKNNQNTPTTIPTTSQNADYGTGALDYWYDPKPIS
jgi:VIT1/CCC1 family predicted Fe2+/Mn2+ transporter